jgi:hypothetical protein
LGCIKSPRLKCACLDLPQSLASRRVHDFSLNDPELLELPMAQAARRNRLTPWYIGIVIILAAVAYTAYQMFVVGCAAPTIVELIVLVTIPTVYLALMYLTLVSQD